jgi:hypothetical protein
VDVPFVPIAIALVAVGLILLIVLVLRMRAAIAKFGIVRSLANQRIGDGTGMLRARSAALGVAVSDLRQDQESRTDPVLGHRLAAGAPRTIELSVEREDHRA